jgi:mRNA interferase RelE/StbE
VSPSSAYTVVLSSAAKRAIERDLPEAVAAAVVDFLFGRLAADPYRVGRLLRLDLEGLWSARRDQYRVIYSLHDDQALVRVVRVSYRADVYPPERAVTPAHHRAGAGSAAGATQRGSSPTRVTRGRRDLPQSTRRPVVARTPRHRHHPMRG